MNNMKENLLKIMVQGLYGNRTITEVNKEELDRFVLGYLDDSIVVTKQVDRTIISVPNTNNIVIVYNKYQEEELFKTKNYELKPVVAIPEKDIEIYSRCIVCRMNDNGELESLQDEDFEKFIEYLAE